MRARLLKIVVVLLGLVVLVVIGFFLAPARALSLATNQVEGLRLAATNGRLWKGEADVVFNGQQLGRLGWSLNPAELLVGRLAAVWQLAHDDYRVSGTVAQGFDSTSFTATGTVDSAAANRLLVQYHMHIAGEFVLDGLAIRVGRDDGATTAQGALRWSGGRAIYRLSGRIHDVHLPAMTGHLGPVDGDPVFTAVSADDGARMLTARLDRDGWVHIGVTARLAALAGNPWQGSNADDDVVVTVAERLFEPRGRSQERPAVP